MSFQVKFGAKNQNRVELTMKIRILAFAGSKKNIWTYD